MAKKNEYLIKSETTIVKPNMFKVYVRISLKTIKNDDGKEIGRIEKYVTKVDYYPSKVFEFKDGESAYEFDSIGKAMDFCMALACNNYCASVELVPTWNPSNLLVNLKEEKKEETK